LTVSINEFVVLNFKLILRKRPGPPFLGWNKDDFFFKPIRDVLL